MVGEFLVMGKERASPVRSDKSADRCALLFITEELGDVDAEEEGQEPDGEGKRREQRDIVTEKVEDVTRGMTEHLEDDNARGLKSSSAIRTSQQPTRQEHESHQTTIHTHSHTHTHILYTVMQVLCCGPSHVNTSCNRGGGGGGDIIQ